MLRKGHLRMQKQLLQISYGQDFFISLHVYQLDDASCD